MAAVNLARLTQKIKESVKMPKKVKYFKCFTDALGVLGMLQTESCKFNEFTSTRVRKIKVKSDMFKDWYWIEGECNPADLVTRDMAKPENLRPDSRYQDRLEWMRLPENKWPCKKIFGPSLEEEIKMDLMTTASNTRAIKNGSNNDSKVDDPFTYPHGGLDKLITVYVNMLLLYTFGGRKPVQIKRCTSIQCKTNISRANHQQIATKWLSCIYCKRPQTG